MEDIYEVLVCDKLFERIILGKCLYYIFLNDKNRLQYKNGNILTFKCGEDKQKVTIVDMLYFSSIKELLDMVGKDKCGYTASQNLDKIEDIYYTHYKAQDIEKYGLVAVKFELNK